MTVIDESTGTTVTMVSYSPPIRNGSPTQNPLEFENDEITEIDAQCYSNNQNLRYVSLPRNVTIIKDNTFRECKKLESITLPDKLNIIGARCFTDCFMLRAIQIPNNVHLIGNGAFENCKNLRHVDLPKNLRSLSYELFSHCNRLNYVEVPKNVKEIHWGAFYKCESLIGISLPDTITKIPVRCFFGCKSLQYFDFTVRNEIDDPYITLGSMAFYDCIGLVKVDLSHSSVYSIGQQCFNNCIKLETVILSNKTKLINKEAFQYCKSLHYIGYEHTQYHEFQGKRLFGIDLQYVTEIDNKAFGDCHKIEYIKLYEKQKLRDNVFDQIKLDYISLPGNMNVPKGHEIFDQKNEVKEVMICSKIPDISCTVAYDILAGLVFKNPILADQPCTVENLYPLEVLIGVLCFGNHPYGYSNREEMKYMNILYRLLRMSPSALEHLIIRNFLTE